MSGWRDWEGRWGGGDASKNEWVGTGNEANSKEVSIKWWQRFSQHLLLLHLMLPQPFLFSRFSLITITPIITVYQRKIKNGKNNLFFPKFGLNKDTIFIDAINMKLHFDMENWMMTWKVETEENVKGNMVNSSIRSRQQISFFQMKWTKQNANT